MYRAWKHESGRNRDECSKEGVLLAEKILKKKGHDPEEILSRTQYVDDHALKTKHMAVEKAVIAESKADKSRTFN